MALDTARFIETRPRLYHLTSRTNLERIRETMELRCASALLVEAGCDELLKARRQESAVVVIDGQRVSIRDQAPLHSGNLALQSGWSFEDLVLHLNRHVFFWPGTTHGPIPYGRRHFQRYQFEDNIVLVVDTASCFKANPAPLFCSYNSGSPRCSAGRKSPRGPDTFRSATDYLSTPSTVVEVTFAGFVSLRNCGMRVAEPQEWLS